MSSIYGLKQHVCSIVKSILGRFLEEIQRTCLSAACRLSTLGWKITVIKMTNFKELHRCRVVGVVWLLHVRHAELLGWVTMCNFWFCCWVCSCVGWDFLFRIWCPKFLSRALLPCTWLLSPGGHTCTFTHTSCDVSEAGVISRKEPWPTSCGQPVHQGGRLLCLSGAPEWAWEVTSPWPCVALPRGPPASAAWSRTFLLLLRWCVPATGTCRVVFLATWCCGGSLWSSSTTPSTFPAAFFAPSATGSQNLEKVSWWYSLADPPSPVPGEVVLFHGAPEVPAMSLFSTLLRKLSWRGGPGGQQGPSLSVLGRSAALSPSRTQPQEAASLTVTTGYTNMTSI